MSFSVFVTSRRLGPSGLALLEQAGARVVHMTHPESVEEFERTIASEPFDALIVRTVECSARAIASCPTLKVIGKHGVGYNNIDVAAATARGIPVYVTPGANAQSVAELAIGLMIAAARKVGWMDRELRAGRWSRAQDGIELHGRTLGLVGFGQVGQRVARIAQAIGMTVAAFDPGLRGRASPVAEVELLDSLDALLARADVLSLHVPANAHTTRMIDSATLSKLPRGAILVNTARGELVDEAAMIAALGDGRLFAAGLDSTWIEPLPADSPLLGVDNLVLTPHVGGSTPAALDAIARASADNVLGWLRGTPVDAALCVNPAVLKTESSVR